MKVANRPVRLREKDRTIVTFVNRKDCTNILRVKKDLKPS